MSQDKDESVVQDIVTYAEHDEFEQAANAIKTKFGIVERWALAGSSRYEIDRRFRRILYLWHLLSGERLPDPEARRRLLASAQVARARRRLVIVTKRLSAKSYQHMLHEERKRPMIFHRLATYCLWLRLPLFHSSDDFVTPRLVHQ